MTSVKKTTAENVGDIEEKEGKHHIKEGSLLEAQGKFSMEYFADYADVASPESATKRLQKKCEKAFDDALEERMSLSAGTNERRDRATRRAERNLLSPIKPKVITFSQMPDRILRTPDKRQRAESKQGTPPPRFGVVCGTPQTRKNPPLATPDWRQRPYRREQRETRPPSEEHEIVPPSQRFKWSKQGHMSPVLDKEFKAQFVRKICEVNERSARECTKAMGQFIRRVDNQWEFKDQARSCSREEQSSRTVSDKSSDQPSMRNERTHAPGRGSALSYSSSFRTAKTTRPAMAKAMARIHNDNSQESVGSQDPDGS